jgi:hypothetical protein
MADMGMQMPGRNRLRAASPNVYTGLLLGAVASLATAVVFVALAGMKIGPGEGPMAALKVHKDSTSITLGR